MFLEKLLPFDPFPFLDRDDPASPVDKFHPVFAAMRTAAATSPKSNMGLRSHLRMSSRGIGSAYPARRQNFHRAGGAAPFTRPHGVPRHSCRILPEARFGLSTNATMSDQFFSPPPGQFCAPRIRLCAGHRWADVTPQHALADGSAALPDGVGRQPVNPVQPRRRPHRPLQNGKRTWRTTHALQKTDN